MNVAVDLRDVFCLYPTPRGHVAALRGLTLRVPAGECVVVHGPNGSGKTTLLRVLTGEQPASAGTALVCGVDLGGAGERDRVRLRRRYLGLVDQHFTDTLRPELSVRDNVALHLRLAGLAGRACRRRAADTLDRLGLAHLADRRPVTLSGGEAQRVAICAAIAHGPALVLADEPTGELDRPAADEVYDLLAATTRAAGAALLLVSHDAGAGRIADRIVRIRDGRLSEEWSPRAEQESLVVDDRGWVRLPERLRVKAGIAGRAFAAAGRDGIVLNAPAAADAMIESPRPASRPARHAGSGLPIMTAEGVSATRSGRVVLSGQSLRLAAGELTVVHGRSGSGKTTLLRILTGLERPDSGSVRILDTDLSGLDRAGLAALRRRYVSVAAQGTALVDALDVVENLALVRQVRGLDPAPDRVEHWIGTLGLGGLRHRPARLLSGGERQRVAVARALAAEPRLAVLDEPTSQQDEANAERLVAALALAATEGAAVVAATHDPVLLAAAGATLRLG